MGLQVDSLFTFYHVVFHHYREEVCFLPLQISADACKCLCSVVILLQMAGIFLHELFVRSEFLRGLDYLDSHTDALCFPASVSFTDTLWVSFHVHSIKATSNLLKLQAHSCFRSVSLLWHKLILCI